MKKKRKVFFSLLVVLALVFSGCPTGGGGGDGGTYTQVGAMGVVDFETGKPVTQGLKCALKPDAPGIDVAAITLHVYNAGFGRKINLKVHDSPVVIGMNLPIGTYTVEVTFYDSKGDPLTPQDTSTTKATVTITDLHLTSVSLSAVFRSPEGTLLVTIDWTVTPLGGLDTLTSTTPGEVVLSGTVGPDSQWLSFTFYTTGTVTAALFIDLDLDGWRDVVICDSLGGIYAIKLTLSGLENLWEDFLVGIDSAAITVKGLQVVGGDTLEFTLQNGGKLYHNFQGQTVSAPTPGQLGVTITSPTTTVSIPNPGSPVFLTVKGMFSGLTTTTSDDRLAVFIQPTWPFYNTMAWKQGFPVLNFSTNTYSSPAQLGDYSSYSPVAGDKFKIITVIAPKAFLDSLPNPVDANTVINSPQIKAITEVEITLQ